MTRLRLVPYRDLRKVVEVVGFQWVRRVRKILRDVGLSIEEYHRLLDKS